MWSCFQPGFKIVTKNLFVANVRSLPILHDKNHDFESYSVAIIWKNLSICVIVIVYQSLLMRFMPEWFFLDENSLPLQLFQIEFQ